MKIINVQRFDPDLGNLGFEEFEVPDTVNTVLDALVLIHQQGENAPQCRYGCRGARLYKCGLCGVLVDGKPRLACNTPLHSGMAVSPLSPLRPLRDLVVDHDFALQRLRELSLYVSKRPEAWPWLAVQPDGREPLMACIDCLCCLTTCPTYSPVEGRGGPWEFVKLAQLWLHPHDDADRVAQANSLGIERCESCRACYCVIGVPIVNKAVGPLLAAGMQTRAQS